jgi:mannose-6-phosphate isomerase-like protein (cupin superfamily)
MGFPMRGLARAEDVHDSYILDELMKPVGDGPRPHTHNVMTEAFYILEGEFTFQLGEQQSRFVAPSGSFVLVPRGTLHSFKNTGTVTGRYLPIFSPPDQPELAEMAARGFDRAPKRGAHVTKEAAAST